MAGKESLLSGKLRADGPLGSYLTTDQLLSDGDWEEIVRELIREVIAGARALGFKLGDDLEQVQIERTRTMGAYKPSSLIDFERGQPIELQSLFLEPLRQIQGAGVSAPRLSVLCSVLGQLDTFKRIS
jgi:2-dehydropantoate 2-reductase